MYVFPTLHLLQSIVRKPILEWYWSKGHCIVTLFARNIMSCYRFRSLRSCIHFIYNNLPIPDNHPNRKFYKIWLIFERINGLFVSAITAEQNICVDESLLLHKGRLGWQQYLPIKWAKFGIKSCTYYEASSEYIYSQTIYITRKTRLYIKSMKIDQNWHKSFYRAWKH